MTETKSKGVSLAYGFVTYLAAAIMDFVVDSITGLDVPFVGLGFGLLIYFVWMKKQNVNTAWFFVGFFMTFIIGLVFVAAVMAFIISRLGGVIV